MGKGSITEGGLTIREGETAMRNRSRKMILRKRKAGRMAARFITVLSALLIFLTAAGSIRSFAGSKKEQRSVSKRYSSIMVYPGDDLGSVADKYQCPELCEKRQLMAEISAINHLTVDDTSLTPGNHIIVPVYSVEYSDPVLSASGS